MSYICGFTSQNSVIGEETLRIMAASMAFRGEGTTDSHIDGDVSICSSRSTNINRARIVSNASKTIIVACEGEIYNRKELLGLLSNRQLPQSNNVFDLIPGLFEEYGRDFAKYLNGSYTLTVWDKKAKTLYLVRDHVGAHSIFYSVRHKGIVFASTAKAILSTGRVDKALDPNSVSAYFSRGLYAPLTMFKHIHSVRPGCMIIFKDGSINEYSYWPLKDVIEDYNRTEESFAEEIKGLILDAVKIRAEYGGEYGAILSGGVDTSTVCSALMPLRNTPSLDVFSIDFENKRYSDAYLQEIMYSRYKLTPNRYILKPKEWSSILLKAADFMDFPVNDVAMVGMYKTFELAKKKGYGVIFEGEGPDEFFGGGHLHGERNIRKFLIIPLPIRKLIFGTLCPSLSPGSANVYKIARLLCRIGLSDEERQMIWYPSFHNKFLKKLLVPDIMKEAKEDPYKIGKKYLSESHSAEPLNKYIYASLIKMHLPDKLLFKNERMASANNMVTRTPLSDYRLIQLSLKMPVRYKCVSPTADFDGIKSAYKKAVQGLIPDEIINRKKTRGFSQPDSGWYRNELKDFLFDNILGSSCPLRGYIDVKFTRKLFDLHVNGRQDIADLLDQILVFSLWMGAVSRVEN